MVFVYTIIRRLAGVASVINPFLLNFFIALIIRSCPSATGEPLSSRDISDGGPKVLITTSASTTAVSMAEAFESSPVTSRKLE